MTNAELYSYSKNTNFGLVDNDGNTVIVTEEMAAEIKEKEKVKSLKELVDNEKAKEKFKKGKNKQNSKTKNNISKMTEYDSNSVTMYDINGEVYTYNLLAYNGYNSRAQIMTEYTGISLIPDGADSKNDFVSAGWVTESAMYVESIQAWTTYTDHYSGSFNKDITNNRQIYSANKISLFYKDTEKNSRGTNCAPTMVFLNLVINKKTKSNQEGFAEIQLAHTYTNVSITPTISIGYPTNVTFQYNGTTNSPDVDFVPIGGRFMY